MAKIVDVTDVPELPGAGLLHFDDGRPPLMALPEIADEHRERLGISAMRDGVAGPGGGDPRDLGSASGAGVFGAPETQEEMIRRRLSAAPPAPAAPAPPPGDPRNLGTPLLAAPPQQAAPPPQATDDLTQQAIEAKRRQAADELLNGKMVAGSAGHAAGYTPQTQKVVTEQGPAYDTRAASERMDAGSAVLDAQLAKAATEKQLADAAAAHAASQNLAAQQQVANQQAEILRKQQEYQRQNEGLTRELASYSEAAQPDPAKFFQRKGPISSLLSIIGQGLGAFGATLGHTDNFAFKAAQAEMQADMAAQEKAYDAGRGDRKSALGRLAEYYHGDIDKAKLALSQAMNKVAETETQSFAAQSQSKEVTANAQVLAAQFQQQQLLDEQRRAELAAGKTTTETSDKFQTGQAASGPHRINLSSAEEERALKRIGGATPPKGAGAKEELKTQIAYGEKKRDLLEGRQAAQEEAAAYGLKVDWETGQLLDKDGKPADADKVTIPGVGRLHMPASGILSTEGARSARRARLKTTSAYRKAITGVAFSPQEAKEAEEATHGETESDSVRTLQDRISHIAEQDRGIDAEHPQWIVDTYRQRQGETSTQHIKRGAVAPKVTKYAPSDDEPEPEQ